MFSTIESFYDVFGVDVPSYYTYRDFYYLDSDDEFVLNNRSFRGGGVFLGEDTENGFVPSLCAVEALDHDVVKLSREESWWFTNHKIVEFEEDGADDFVLVVYDGMVLGIGRFDGAVLVPVFDVGYFLRSGY